MNFNISRIRLFIVMWLTITTAALSQERKLLSLKEALELADANNYDARLAVASEDVARAERAKGNAVFLPNISLSQTLVRTNDPLAAFGFKLKQRVVTQNDFNPTLLNNPDEATNFSTRIDIQQPIFNPDGLVGRWAAEHNVSRAALQTRRAKYAVALGVKQAYFQLALAQEAFLVTERAVTSAEENRNVAKNFAEKGMMSNADAMLAEVRFLEVQKNYAEAELQLSKAREQLALALALPEKTEIVATDSLRLVQPKSVPPPIAFDAIRSERSDLQAMKEAVSGAEKMVTMNALSFAPRLNAFGNYEFNDPKFFGFNANNWTIGLSLQWEVFKGFQDVGNVQKSRAELTLARANAEKRERESRVEFLTALKAYETAKKKYALSEQALSQATEYLRIIKDRYTKGMEKTAEVLNGETTFLNVRLQFLQATFEHNMAVYQLEFLTEQSLTNN
jgi:outer membrane protein TolC